MNSEFQPQTQDDDPNFAPQEREDESSERLARLQASPDEENLPIRMRLVDQLLAHTPMALPRPDFAFRVMAALKERTPYILKPHVGLGLALGLSVSAGFAVLMMVVALLLILLIVLNWSDVYEVLARALGEVGTTLGSLLDDIGQLISDAPPLAVIITLLALPAFLLWIWWFRGRAKATETK
ncbi:MAG: hypothetical protein K8I82_05980 [Anaerolineae bacterium]|nr:hypothetical protein [Anaerolineae bacterium]